MALDQIDADQYEWEDGKVKKVEKEMSFLEHLEELRWHILRSLVAVVVLTVVIFLFKDFVFNEIVFAPKNQGFITYRMMCKAGSLLHLSSLCIEPPIIKLIATDIGATFFAHFQISFFLGVVVAFPYIFWEIWRFISPGLHENERKAARGIVAVCSLLFTTGVLFGYFIIAPFAISFLAGYEIPDTVISPTISSYIGYMIMFTLPIGLVFELPVVVYFFSRIGLVTPQLMREYRKHVVVVILIVAGVITPSPDIMSQLLVGFPLYFLFEASIIVSHRVVKQLEKEQMD